MRRRHAAPALALGFLTTLVGLGAGTSSCAPRSPTPESVLSRASSAYRAMGSFRGSMSLTVTLPEGETQERIIEYGAGPEGVFVDAGFQRIVATLGRVRVMQADVEDRYVSAPFDGDFGAALAAIGGAQLQIPDLPPIELHQSSELADWTDSFRFRVLGPVELGEEVSMTSKGGDRVHELTLTADNGVVRAGFDVESGLLVSLEMEATPPGAPQTVRISASGRFAVQPTEGLNELLAFDPEQRMAVMDLAALGSGSIETGAAVQPLVLETLRGASVDLAELRGRVVVLDFWASWCGPCWGTLEKLEEVVAWAEASGLPVTVWAVNTAEGIDAAGAQREKVAPLWRERAFAMDSLIDPGGELFASIGAPGLPSTVILSPEGTLAGIHLGVLEEPRATLEAEIRALLEAR